MMIVILLSMLGILGFAWVVGRIHISLVDPSEVGKLTPAHFTARMIVSFGPLSALFVVLGVFREIFDLLSRKGRLCLVVMLGVSGLFAVVIAIFSLMEVFWYQAKVLPSHSRRRRFFKAVCLPVLYSSVYLYWAPLILAWLLFIRAILRW